MFVAYMAKMESEKRIEVFEGISVGKKGTIAINGKYITTALKPAEVYQKIVVGIVNKEDLIIVN